MKVRNWMTPDPITVGPETLLMEARELMDDNRIRRLPVVDKKGRLVGMVTLRRILEAMPSEATSLSVQERNYLLSRLRVGDIMQKDPVAVSSEDFVMDVIRLGQERGIGAFPVVDNGRLVGIATETEIFNATMHVIGARAGQSVVVLEGVDIQNDLGAMSRIARIVESHGAPVEAIFSLPHRASQGHRVYIRAKTEQAQSLRGDLAAAGYKVEQ